MFDELKKCRTLKEIFDCLGVAFFEKNSVRILTVWCILPVFSIISHIIRANQGISEGMYTLLTSYDYQYFILIIGAVNIALVISYFTKQCIDNKGSVTAALIKHFKQRPWEALLTLMLFWSLICALLSENYTLAFFGSYYRGEGFVTYLYYACIYITACYMVPHSKIRRVFDIYCAMTVVLCICFICQENSIPFIGTIFWNYRATVFNQFNHFGYYLSMSVLLFAGLYMYEKNIKRACLYITGMILSVWVLIANNTFGTYLGALAGLCALVAFFLMNKTEVKRKIILPVAVFITLSVMSCFNMIPSSAGESLLSNFVDLKNDTKAVIKNSEDSGSAGTGRMALWRVSVEMISKSPVFGYGPEQIGPDPNNVMWYTDRPENEYIQYALFLGLPGGIVYIISLMIAFVYYLRRIKGLRGVVIISAGCVFAYLARAMFGNSMCYTTPYFFMFFGFTMKMMENAIYLYDK